MLLGYARVSSLGQNLDRQIDALTSAGIDPRMIYQEKITETKMQRPELNRLLNDIQQGDVLIIPDLTRISRSTKDLLMIVEKVRSKGPVSKTSRTLGWILLPTIPTTSFFLPYPQKGWT